MRSTLPHLHHWTGLRLSLGVPALLQFFDPLTQYFWQKYLTDQEILRQPLRTILKLSACLIWARLEHGKTRTGQEMCRKKCQNFDENWKIWWFSKVYFWSTRKHSEIKKQHFKQKTTIHNPKSDILSKQQKSITQKSTFWIKNKNPRRQKQHVDENTRILKATFWPKTQNP